MPKKNPNSPLRWARILTRTAHILTASVLVGGHVFARPATELRPWLYATIATGLILVITDLVGGLIWLRELRGLAVILKVALLLVIPFWWDARVPILFAVVVIGGIASHMPGYYRYWVLGRGPR